jgi:hypothetical protein
MVQASKRDVRNSYTVHQGDDSSDTSDSKDSETSDSEDHETSDSETSHSDTEHKTDTTDDHSDKEDQAQKEKDAYEREVEFEQQDKEFKAKSKLKSGNSQDEFELEFKAGGGDAPEIKLKYKSESSSTHTELEYKVQFDSLIEFSENSNLVGYDANDTVLSEYDLGNTSWDPVVYSQTTDNGVTIYEAAVSTADGVFTLRMYLAGSFAQVNGSSLTPNALKIDVEVHNYQYVSNSSYLSLETDIKSQSQSEYHEKEDTVEEQAGFSSNEAEVSIGSSNSTGYFSWVETATADGSNVPVVYSGIITDGNQDDDDIESENKGTVYFTFDAQAPKDLIWDPKVGVVSEGALSIISALQSASNVSDALSALPGFGIFVAIFGIISLSGLATYRRKRY